MVQSNFSQGLYIVATPIGNLRDITLRALDVLRSADRILAEDTRQTQKLLKAYDIEKPLTAYHDHNVANMIPKIISWLDQGEIVAQVSDAGTPLISDPGYKLVRAAIDHGHTVIPLPGATAPIVALMAAGLPTDRFLFLGFLPSKSQARKNLIQEFAATPASLIFFESPNRVLKALIDLQDVLGNRQVVLARELTKKYEEFRRGTLADIIKSVEVTPPKGEIVIIIEPPKDVEKWSEAEVKDALQKRLPELGAKLASKEISDLSGWKKRELYQMALKLQ